MRTESCVHIGVLHRGLEGNQNGGQNRQEVKLLHAELLLMLVTSTA